MYGNLLQHVASKAGNWHTSSERFAAHRIKLVGLEDEVTLAGPLAVNVAVVAEQTVRSVFTQGEQQVSSDLYNYDVEIPAGHTWTYRLSEAVIPIGQVQRAGFSVIIRPTAPKRPTLVQPSADVPCDFAVAPLPSTAEFFPSACEACPPGSVVSLPPTCAPALNVPTSKGGCVRPRYFNGMFITREDLETDLRYVRLKNRLHNRAAGEGVVWGLNVRREGSKICVDPGYAVDCCGNDLTVTCKYCVDVPTLLCDPAAQRALGAGQRRLHLLLEYVECPEQPRPVHGDVCSPQTTACEMSRVRETVRLRLVPPRDYKPGGPIGQFLAELGLKSDAIRDTSASRTEASPQPPARVGDEVPFSVELTITSFTVPDNRNSLRLPPLKFGETAVDRLTGVRKDPQVNLGITITVACNPNFQFSAGRVIQTRGAQQAQVPEVTAPVNQLQWSTAARFVDSREQETELVFRIENWKVASTSGGSPAISGSTDIALRVLFNNADLNDLEASATTLVPVSPERPGRLPCFTEPCDRGGSPRFPVIPPWSHPHPTSPGRAADPEVLSLALRFAVLVLQAAARRGTDASSAPLKPGNLVATSLPFGLTAGPQLIEALQRLLAGWCQGLLYGGPQCTHDPHGVVIGCVCVEGGDICHVDPWGGRRWVVHYPLISHWAEQFGIAPLDLTASRLFGLICCIAGIPLPARGDVAGGERPPITVVPVRNGFFAVGDAEAVDAELSRVRAAPVDVRTVGLAEFFRWAVQVEERPLPPDAPLVRYTLEAMPSVHFVAPAAAAQVAAPDRGRLVAIARAGLGDRRATLPPLLRSFADDVSAELLSELPLSNLPERESPVGPTLSAAGISTVGAVLSRDPEMLYDVVLNRTAAAPLTSLLAESEKLAQTLSLTVVDTILRVSEENSLIARDQFQPDEQRAQLEKSLSAQLRRANLDISPDTVSSAVRRALGEKVEVRE